MEKDTGINTPLDTITGESSVGIKYDKDKPIAGALQDFSLALMEVSKLMTFGANKYERSSWSSVPSGQVRYTDAMVRHWLLEGTEANDQETGLGHDVAVAWNALCRLELRLREERNGSSSEPNY